MIERSQSFLVLGLLLPLVSAFSVRAQPQGPVFKTSSNLQTIAVQVADREGNLVQGLSASNFTLLEDGRRQKIAFFAAENQPLSLAILIDASRSMDFGGKLDRARVLLAPLLRGNRPDDEIFLVPFTDQVGNFKQLSFEERLRPPAIPRLGHGGSALYDALASALCHMRTAKNIRRAVVVLTDGVDEHSRLQLEQLLDLVRSSTPQVFMIGFYDKPEYEVYKQSRKTVTIVGLREIDNPLVVFNRLAEESGAESFFPSSDRALKKVLDHIYALLEGQYTLAYYPQRIDKTRKIEVKVNRTGVKVTARRTVGPETGPQSVYFRATSCEVSPEDHPYPWELRMSSSSFYTRIYHEDFSDPRSGWPDRPFDWHTGSRAHYASNGYELYRTGSLVMPVSVTNGAIAGSADTEIAAYGPWWDNFQATALLEGRWYGPDHTQNASHSAVGMVFNVTEQGYYAFLLNVGGNRKSIVFDLVKGDWHGKRSAIIPWTSIASVEHPATVHKLLVECNRGRITLMIDDRSVGNIQDTTFRYGLVGFGVFGDGRAIVHDLLVRALR